MTCACDNDLPCQWSVVSCPLSVVRCQMSVAVTFEVVDMQNVTNEPNDARKT